MIDNRFDRIYHILLFVIMSTMIFVIGLLFFQYKFFCAHVQELITLKHTYYGYIDEIQKKENDKNYDIFSDSDNNIVIEEELSDDPDDDDEYIDESFIAINREPDYLKESTVHYLQTEQLDDLMTKIDMSQWSDYTEQTVITVPSNKKNTVQKITSPQKQKTFTKKPIKDFGLSWPIDKDKFWLSSLFGPRKRINGTWGFHHGIDMAAVKGTTVKAARSGKIVEASFQSGYGNTVVIEHSAHIKTRYAHLHTIRVYVGQMVQLGTIVGTVGETGFIRKKGKDGSHLHFEVYEHGKRINPLHCLP